MKRIEHELFSNRDFLMQLRQNWLGLIAVVERELGCEPTTKEKCDWWDGRFSSTNTTRSHQLDWETDTS